MAYEMDSQIELKILCVPIEGRPTLTFHRGTIQAERDFEEMIDSGANLRVKMWIENEEEPCKKWPEASK